MDKKSIQIPGVGVFEEGKLIVMRDKKDRVFRGYLQSVGDFINIWHEDYLHCVRLSEIEYIGTERKVEKQAAAPKQVKEKTDQ